MPLIQILSAKKQTAYEEVPQFSAQNRKRFLTLPASLQMQVNSFPVLTNRIGFRLMFGYFLATKQFYSPDQFHPKDIRFLCNQYGLMPFAFETDQYKESTYHRHRQIILEHFAFKNYQPKLHNRLIEEVIQDQIYSWEKPALIVDYVLEWLEWRRIERPSYYNLQLVLTQSIRNRNRAIKEKFGQLLDANHKAALDKLMEKQVENNTEEYVLTSLKKLSPSDAPSKIRANIEKLNIIQNTFETLQPLLAQLNLNDQALQYFGEIVRRSEASHIVRKEKTDCYFHLTIFCAYQRRIFEDWMARTLTSVCKVAANKATAREKEWLFQERKKRKKAFKQVLDIAENKTELLENIKQLAWLNISAAEKERRLQQFFPQEQTTIQTENLQQIREEHQLNGRDEYYRYLAEESQSLQQRVNPIIKKMTFNKATSDKLLLSAVQYFRDKQGLITRTAPIDFLKQEDKDALTDETGKFQISLYKILLFQYLTNGIERGSMNLKYTYKYKDMEKNLIPKALWEKDPDSFLDKANLSHLKTPDSRIAAYKKMLHHHFQNTNTRILNGKNSHFRKSKNGKYHVVTPKVEKEEIDFSLFPSQAAIPLSQVLSTVDNACNFLTHFEHLQPMYRKSRPNKSLFFAGITAFGCNLGIHTMAKTASQVHANQLENASKWYFDLKNINKANDAISNFINQLPLANLYRKKQGELRTSSDGQKIQLRSTDTIFANYSGKYFKKGKGIVSYTFVDERYIPFYSVIIDAAVREAAFVVDGLLHNDTIKSTIHTTDTHGYTEAVFGLTDLLGFGFCPNIAKMLRQKIYTFKENPIASYKEKGYLVLPQHYIKEELIRDNWSEILRLITSLKLKYCTASEIFTRFNSYSKQHPLYAALKEYGKLAKTLHILRFTDDLEMRQDSRKSSNAIESSNRFSSAIFFANGGEMIYLTRTEQQIADACKNLIKNAVICWNYLYLTRKIQRTKNQSQYKELIEIAKQKTMNAWQHIYFIGTYDFSEENMADSFNLLLSQNYDVNIDSFWE